MALSSVSMTDTRFAAEIDDREKHWNGGAVKCLDILMEGIVDYRRLEDFGDVVNL